MYIEEYVYLSLCLVDTEMEFLNEVCYLFWIIFLVLVLFFIIAWTLLEKWLLTSKGSFFDGYFKMNLNMFVHLD